jgi:putative salt-induced outer membrane protein YdiY
MKIKASIYLWAAGILAVSLLDSYAQPATVTVTNYVTVTVTNVVTITNVVPPAPASTAGSAIAAGVPPAPAVTPKSSWQNAVSVGMTLARGNSDNMLFTADYLAQRKTPTDEYKLGLSGAYGEQDAKDTINDYKVFGQWNHMFTDRFYGYVRTDGLKDVIADVDYRATIGPGVGYYLLKATNTTLAAEAGDAFEAQRLDGQGDQTFDTIRFAERFEHKVNERVHIWENVEILPQVDKFDNYVVNSEVGLESLLSKSFTLKTFLDDNYDHRPAPGKLKNDVRLVTALGYKF